MRKTIVSLLFLFAICCGRADAGITMSTAEPIPPEGMMKGKSVQFTFSQKDDGIGGLIEFSGGTATRINDGPNPIPGVSSHQESFQFSVFGNPVTNTLGLSVPFTVSYDPTSSKLSIGMTLLGQSVGSSCPHFDYWDFLQTDIDYFQIGGSSGVTLTNLSLNGSPFAVSPSGDGSFNAFGSLSNSIAEDSEIKLTGNIALGTNWNDLTFTWGTFVPQDTNPTPEPGTLLMFGLSGLAAIPVIRKRRRLLNAK